MHLNRTGLSDGRVESLTKKKFLQRIFCKDSKSL